MKFSTPKLILDTLKAGDDCERERSKNRRLVVSMFQGKPYLDKEMMKKWKLDIGANFGEAPILFAHAKRQYENSVLGPEVYFKVTLPKAPEEKKSDWGSFITNEIGEIMKGSREFTCLKEYQIASIVSHGPGIEMWRDQEDWLSDFVPCRNFRVPTDTLTSFKDQSWVDERHDYSPGELRRKVFGKHADPHWNKKAIQTILARYDDTNYETGRGDWNTNPEEREEMWRQNDGYFSSDAMPSISLHHFHYYDDSDPKDCFWKLCVVPDWGERAPRGVSEPVFLYQSDEMFARKIENFLSVQTGDLNTDAPFHYHSMRSLGFSLLEPCFWNNLAICRLLQHLLESYNPWIRVEDPDDRARVNMVNLAGVAVLPKGVSIVPNTERHKVEPQLIESTMAKLKQVMSEASTSYTQSTDNGTAREQTAFETRVKLTTVNAMMTGLLGRYFRNEVFAHRERCRRFCLRGTSNPDAKRFQEACIKEGIPRVWLDAKHWKIEPEVPMGSGNPTMAMTMIEQLMGLYPMLSPTAQTEVVHEALEVYTGDPRKAQRWQPIGKEAMLSEGKQLAAAVFGSLMTGVPVPIKEGVPPADLIETWLGMMSGVISRIEKTDGMGTMPELTGLQNVAQAIGEQIQRLAQIQTEKQRVKQYGDDLGKLMNEVKAFGQRLAEKNAQSNGQPDPETLSKIAATKMKTESDIENKQMKLAQGLEHGQIKMTKDQERKDTSAAAEQRRQDAILNAELEREEIRTGSEIGNETAKTGSEIASGEAKAQADIASGKAKANADVANAKKKAAATPKTAKAKKE